jgi:hypothetical protein
MQPDQGLMAERDRMIGEHLAKRPPWWRLFARRRWRARLSALRATDVSSMTAMLRAVYTPESVQQLAQRGDVASRLRGVLKARTERKAAETEHEADRLALEVDVRNGSNVYSKWRAERRAPPADHDRHILRTVETDE